MYFGSYSGLASLATKISNLEAFQIYEIGLSVHHFLWFEGMSYLEEFLLTCMCELW